MIQQQVEAMLVDSIIETSTLAFAAIVVVVKKEGRLPAHLYRPPQAERCEGRHAVDNACHSRPAARHQRRHSTHHPRLEGRLLTPESKPLTALVAPDGAAYQFRVMPFGLQNATESFQWLMSQEVLVGYINRFCLVYLDNIVYSKGPKDHLHHLRLIVERLQQHGLRCHLKKCDFGKKRIRYLGHEIGADGNTPQAEHLRNLRKFPSPRTKRQLRQFLGVANWLRKYVL